MGPSVRESSWDAGRPPLDDTEEGVGRDGRAGCGGEGVRGAFGGGSRALVTRICHFISKVPFEL